MLAREPHPGSLTRVFIVTGANSGLGLHLGHFLLTALLLDRMAPAGRIVAVSSDMHSPPGPSLRWPGAAALAEPKSPAASSARRYSYSKLSNIYFVHEVGRGAGAPRL